MIMSSIDEQKSTKNEMMKDKRKIYHEKQSRQLCALHALNNLFQDANAFTKNDLDLIAESLPATNYRILNPHKSALGFGNYDINVILVALQNKNFEAHWFNKNKDPKFLNLDEILGFILNIPNNCDFLKTALTFFTSSRRHWIAIRKIDLDSQYYNLDSKLKEPLIIGNEEKLLDYLKKNLSEKNVEVFVIAQKDKCWYKAIGS